MRRHYGGHAIASGTLILALALVGLPRDAGAGSVTIFMTAAELKGATTADKLAPPGQDPHDLSKGYEFKGPGVAEPRDPKRWQVSSYLFTPGYITVRKGDTVTLNVFVVNGDAHEVRVVAPDGREVVPKTTWNRGREYRVTFRADQAGSYALTCATHAPTMAATIMALP